MSLNVPSVDHELARLSAWVYQPPSEVRRRTRERGWTIRAWHDVGGTQAFVVESDVYAALVFRGTQVSSGGFAERVEDGTANMRVCPHDWRGPGRAHAGYAAALARVYQPAREVVESVARSLPVYITGHSLGGALATLYAARVAAVDGSHGIAGLVTFGAPKPATKGAYTRLGHQTPIRRYVMPMDFAPFWPPGFAHPAPETRLEPVDSWPGPVTRHAVGGYVAAVE